MKRTEFSQPSTGWRHRFRQLFHGRLGLLLLGTREGDRCHLVAGVTADLTGKYSASDIVKKAAARVGGGGGGRKDMAQAGGSLLSGLPEGLATLSEW